MGVCGVRLRSFDAVKPESITMMKVLERENHFMGFDSLSHSGRVPDHEFDEIRPDEKPHWRVLGRDRLTLRELRGISSSDISLSISRMDNGGAGRGRCTGDIGNGVEPAGPVTAWSGITSDETPVECTGRA